MSGSKFCIHGGSRVKALAALSASCLFLRQRTIFKQLRYQGIYPIAKGLQNLRQAVIRERNDQLMKLFNQFVHAARIVQRVRSIQKRPLLYFAHKVCSIDRGPTLYVHSIHDFFGTFFLRANAWDAP